MCKGTSMFAKFLFKGPCVEPTYYFFNISTNVTIVRSMTMYLHLIHDKLKLTLPLKEAISFICTITFTLIILKFCNVTFIK